MARKRKPKRWPGEPPDPYKVLAELDKLYRSRRPRKKPVPPPSPVLADISAARERRRREEKPN